MISTSEIRIERLTQVDAIRRLRPEWNALAGGIPFRTFEWSESWWQTYGVASGGELLVLCARDGSGRLLGIAPWYLCGPPHARIIRFLGSGEVCSDYLTILCREDCDYEVMQALAMWLCSAEFSASTGLPDWERLEMEGVDEEDQTVGLLLDQLGRHGRLVHRFHRPSCWRVALPSEWEAYLATLSKSHRKQIRRLERKYFHSGRARLHWVTDLPALTQGLAVLADLHQRRRISRGERGCFDSRLFTDFLSRVSSQLFALSDLRLVMLELDGRFVAADYQIVGGHTVFAYQSGMEPDALEHEPGRLLMLGMLKQAMAENRQVFDFLRGDELYKAHWRAQPRRMFDVRVAADTKIERLRQNLWIAGDNVKSWIKKRLHISGVSMR
jgi:CelD/BcsL family acetyltransferase involved in cellulose biosynthesis